MRPDLPTGVVSLLLGLVGLDAVIDESLGCEHPAPIARIA